MADERVKLDDDFETLQRLIDAEWRRWDDEYGPEEGVLAPRHYDLALKNIKDEIARLEELNEALKRVGSRAAREAEAAEAKIARLQDGLREIAEPRSNPGFAMTAQEKARALLAEDNNEN